MNKAVDQVQKRLERTIQVLNESKVPYVVVGGNAVRAWVSQADEAAVRNTRDVDILLNREDRERAIQAMERAGFVFRVVKGIPMFLDGPTAKPRDAVHVLYANNRIRPSDVVETPGVDSAVLFGDMRVVNLKSLVTMKLNSNRDKDRMHLRDLIDVGLVDESFCNDLPEELRTRLRTILETPEDEGLEIDSDEA
jgi:hypothetical protein